jgi:Uma2 family endonuclease
MKTGGSIMFSIEKNSPKLTPEEYFAWEEQLERHEYINGEVYAMSGGTVNHDRGEKFYRYRRNPVLQDYLLVSDKSISIDLHRKNDAGEWVIINYRAGDLVELKSINLSFPIERVYRGIVFDADVKI